MFSRTELMIRLILIALTALMIHLFTLNPVCAAGSADFLTNIEKTLSGADIDRARTLNLRVASLFGQNRLSRDSRPCCPAKTGTFILVEARRYRHLLDPEYHYILQRPTDSGDNDYYGHGIDVWSIETEHFTIHYTEDGRYGDAVPGSDGSRDTVPWYVTTMGDYFEQVWDYEVGTLGYRSPPPDAGRGGSDNFDVYLLDINAYGYTTIDENGYLYIVLDNDFESFPTNLDPEGDQKGCMKVTAAHEFFHVLQYEYGAWREPSNWWLENTAVWMEDEIFDDVDDYLNYLGYIYEDANDNGRWDSGEVYYDLDGSVLGTTGRPKGWADCPDTPIDTFNGYYEYGGVVWAKYLAEKYGDGFIKNVFHGLGGARNAIEVISDELNYRGYSLADAVADFRVKYILQDFEEGLKYPLPRHRASFETYPASVMGNRMPPDFNAGLSHLSCEYVAFRPGHADSVTFTLSVGESNIADFSMTAVGFMKDDSEEVEQIDFDPQTGVAELELSQFREQYDKVVFVPVNVSTTSDRVSYRIFADVQEDDGNQTNLFFPQIAAGDGKWTAIGLLNTGEKLADVTLILYGRNGRVLATTVRYFAPFEKKLMYMRELFPKVNIPEDEAVVEAVTVNPDFMGFEMWGEGNKYVSGLMTGGKQGRCCTESGRTRP